MELLTNSRLKAFRRCARLHHLQYELGYRPREDVAALRFGSLIHAGLETWWKWHMDARGDLEAADAALVAALWRVRGETSDPYELARAEVLLEGYHARWAGAMAELEVLGVELEFVAALINPATGSPSRTFLLAGKLDALARERSSGRAIIVEHKTSSDDVGVGSTYWKRLRMDGQVSQYFVGAAALGYPAGECLYDVIGKPTLRPAKATPLEARKYTKDGRLYATQREADESPDEYKDRLRQAIAADPDRYYQRGAVVRLEEEMEDHRYDLWQTADIIRESRVSRRAPKNPEGCVAYGRTCGFFAACTGGASLDDEALFEKLDNPHTELAQAS